MKGLSAKKNLGPELKHVMPCFSNNSTGLLWNIKQMKHLLEDIINDWEYWLPKPEVEILQKYALQGRTITIAYASNVLFISYKNTFLFFVLK